MATYRVSSRKGRPFVQVDKTATEDSRLSWKSRGLLAYLLSKPDTWKFHLETIADDGPDGIASVRSGIKELEELGYINRYPTKDKGKIVSWNIDVFEIPDTRMQFSTSGNSTSGKSHAINNDLRDNDLREKDNKNTSNYHSTARFLNEYKHGLKDDIEEYLTYFYNAYEEYRGEEHPRLKIEQLENVYEVIHQAMYDYDEAIYGAVDDFFTTVKSNDYNINHFVHHEIIIRLCERNK